MSTHRISILRSLSLSLTHTRARTPPPHTHTRPARAARGAPRPHTAGRQTQPEAPGGGARNPTLDCYTSDNSSMEGLGAPRMCFSFRSCGANMSNRPRCWFRTPGAIDDDYVCGCGDVGECGEALEARRALETVGALGARRGASANIFSRDTNSDNNAPKMLSFATAISKLLLTL